MLKINFLIIFFLFSFVLINGIDEDLFDDLWKNLKPSTSKNLKKPKFGEMNAIKEEIVDKNEMHEQQNSIKIEMEDIKPKELQKIKKEKTLEEQNNKLSEELFENEFDEEADQNVSFTDQSNSADDEDYNNMESEKINEIKILNKFNLMRTELRKENVYKTLTYFQFECEIAKKLGTNRWKIYKLKRKLEQKRENRTEESNERKMKLIRNYDQLRKEKIWEFKYDKKKRNEIECEIAKELKINRKKIYKWKKEFGLLKKLSLSKEQQSEKIEQFEKVKEEICKKFNLKTTKKINQKIAKKIGVGMSTIYRWKMRKIGSCTHKIKIYTNAEKLEYVKRGEEMRKRNPMMTEWKIAEKLGIFRSSLRRWTMKFGSKLIH